MVQQALAALEARGFDFSTLDSDNDGWVDGLTVIHAGGGEEYTGNNANYIWSHQWEMTSTVTYDGKSNCGTTIRSPSAGGGTAAPAPGASRASASSATRTATSWACRICTTTVTTAKAPANFA